jgi:hypothetical protein
MRPVHNWGGFHKAIYALRLKFVLCAHLLSLILHYVFAPFGQLIAFFPDFTFYAVRPTFMKSTPDLVNFMFDNLQK